MATHPPSPSLSALPPIPGSPYSYASTANPLSSYNLPLPPPPRSPHAVLNKADLESSHTAYTELLTSAKTYRLALASLSLSASNFGSALEACARLKEARSEAMAAPGGSMSNSFSAKGTCTSDTIMAASGVHQLIANHQQILSETVYRSFEVPLLHELDQWQRRMEEEEAAYQKEAKIVSLQIRKMEKEGLRLHGQRKRDVGKFREHLVQLTMKLDSLTGLSGGHSRGLLRDCQEMSRGIVECSAGLVRAEVDIFEALARKGWNGGGLDELLEKGKDFFANEGDGDAHPNQGAKIFSILASEDSRGGRSESLLEGGGGGFQSLAGAVQGRDRDADVASIFSVGEMGMSGILSRPRPTRPFSPVPGERVEDPLASIPHFAPVFKFGEGEDKKEETGSTEETFASAQISNLGLEERLSTLPPPEFEGEGGEEEDEDDEEALTEHNTPVKSSVGGKEYSHESASESIQDSSSTSRSKRERRWSVNDGVCV